MTAAPGNDTATAMMFATLPCSVMGTLLTDLLILLQKNRMVLFKMDTTSYRKPIPTKEWTEWEKTI